MSRLVASAVVIGRIWLWAIALTVAGAVVLAVSIHSVVRWSPPRGSVEVITLGQLMGFVLATLLLAVASLLVLAGLRSRRNGSWQRRRLRR